MAWATTSEVEDVTGETVTAPQLAQAQAVVELHVGRTPDADAAATARDLYWLKQAVCWQAPWQRDQPAYHNRAAVSSVNQDGLQFSYTSQSAVALAPLAIRAIKNLSWIRTRSVALSRAVAPPAAFNMEASDSSHTWVPL